MRQHHADHAATLQVQVGAAREEQPGHVLIAGVPAAGPDVVDVLALLLQRRPQRAGRFVVVQPRWIADHHVHLAVGQGHRPHQIPAVVRPDVVAALGVQPLHLGDGPVQRVPFLRVADAVVGQCQGRVAPALDGPGHVAHQRVERIGLLDQPARKAQHRVSLVVNVDRYVPLREQVAVVAQLQGVAQVDRHGDWLDRYPASPAA